MRYKLLTIALPMLLRILPAAAAPHDDGARGPHAGSEAADTTITVDKVQITAIKQGLVLRSEPVASTIVGSRDISRRHVDALAELSQQVPNLHIPDYGSRMTSSIYVRGLGARIDQPVIGLNIDNVPVLNKDNFDTELAEVERIEVLRGPQSTLYGRNTMGGVINIYTLSPLAWQGVRLMAEYGNGASARIRASLYEKLTPEVGMSVSGYYTRSNGFFTNDYTGERCDREQLGGGRWRTLWDNGRGLRLDNTFSFSVLDQGGYPYAYAGEEPLVLDGREVIRPGQIACNDPCSYRRTLLNDGLTVRYDADAFTVSSITSYQYSDDAMTLDQDFLPLSYFTLTQARTEHSLTEDLVFRSRDDHAYRWLFGAFGFYRHTRMEAPVHFKRTGIEELILRNANTNPDLLYGIEAEELPLESYFRMPVYGAALYHESRYALGRWLFTAGIRADFEHTRLRYRSRAELDYTLRVTGGPPAADRVEIDAVACREQLPGCPVPEVGMEQQVLYAYLLGKITERDRIGRLDQRRERLDSLPVISGGAIGRGEHEAAVTLLLRIAVGAGRLNGLRKGFHGIVSLLEIEQSQRMVNGHEQCLGPLPQRIIEASPGKGLFSQDRRLGITPDALLHIADTDMGLGIGVPRYGTLTVRTVAVEIPHAPVERCLARKRISRRDLGQPQHQRPPGPVVAAHPLRIHRSQQAPGTVGMLNGQEAIDRDIRLLPMTASNGQQENDYGDPPYDISFHFHLSK